MRFVSEKSYRGRVLRVTFTDRYNNGRAARERARRVLLFLLVCALHGVLGWFLLAASRVMPLNTHARGFDLLMLAPAPVSFPNVRPQSGPPRAVSRTSRHRVVETKKEVDSSEPSNAITPPIDWNAEISRAGRAASGLDPKNPAKDFGFPKTPPTMADYPQFDWDYARTHRVESIPEGGVVIHLNDNCVLVLNPLPGAFCWPFKRAANGELFKHMRDPDNSGDAHLP